MRLLNTIPFVFLIAATPYRSAAQMIAPAACSARYESVKTAASGALQSVPMADRADRQRLVNLINAIDGLEDLIQTKPELAPSVCGATLEKAEAEARGWKAKGWVSLEDSQDAQTSKTLSDAVDQLGK